MQPKDYEIDEEDSTALEPRVFDFDQWGDHSDGSFPGGLPTPLQRPVCQRCFIELPVSLVCGTCC